MKYFKKTSDCDIQVDGGQVHGGQVQGRLCCLLSERSSLALDGTQFAVSPEHNQVPCDGVGMSAEVHRWPFSMPQFRMKRGVIEE